MDQTTQNVMFFDEGCGFLHVKTLGQGAFGCITLVRSIHNNKLYVRKEEIWYEQYEKGSDNKTLPTVGPEVAIALKARHLESVYKVKGSVRYIDETLTMAGDVSYWPYYNLGSMKSIHDTALEHDELLPEPLICRWLVFMLETIIQVHEAGILHRDTQVPNWLLHREGDDIKIILGDFGFALPRAGYSRRGWLQGLPNDVHGILQSMYFLLGLREEWEEVNILTLPPSRYAHCSPALIETLMGLQNLKRRNPRSTRKFHNALKGFIADIKQYQGPFSVSECPYLRPTIPYIEFGPLENMTEQLEVNPENFKSYWVATVTLCGCKDGCQDDCLSIIKLEHASGAFLAPADEEPWTAVNEMFEPKAIVRRKRYTVQR